MTYDTHKLNRLMQENESASAHIRDLFIMIDELPSETEAQAYYTESPTIEFYQVDLDFFMSLWQSVRTLYENPWVREDFTRLALEQSLCPLHLVDYAICFDDDDQECAAIRIVHPSHDT